MMNNRNGGPYFAVAMAVLGVFVSFPSMVLFTATIEHVEVLC